MPTTVHGVSCMLDQSGKPCDGRTVRYNNTFEHHAPPGMWHSYLGLKPGLVNHGVDIDYPNHEVRLTIDLARELFKVAPTADSADRAGRCLRELHSIVRQFGPEWHVKPFGSFANGFATVFSDLDITCCQAGCTGDDMEQHSVTVLGAIACVLRTHPLFVVEEERLGASVPILKIRFENMLDADISCHNLMPLLNTRLLLAYSRMDPIVRDLGVAIKLWSKKAGVCDATKKHLSSYSFTLLVIYFLQVHPDVRLPVLPVEAFEDHGMQENDLRVINAKVQWRCELSLQGLMTRFFSFYANHDSKGFCWGREVASVRLGERCMIEEVAFSSLRGRHVQRLHIEDPYQLERNLHCVLGKVDEEEHLRNALREAFTDLQQFQVPRAFKANLTSAYLEKEYSLTTPHLLAADSTNDKNAFQANPTYASLEKEDPLTTPPLLAVDGTNDKNSFKANPTYASLERLEPLTTPPLLATNGTNDKNAFKANPTYASLERLDPLTTPPFLAANGRKDKNAFKANPTRASLVKEDPLTTPPLLAADGTNDKNAFKANPTRASLEKECSLTTPPLLAVNGRKDKKKAWEEDSCIVCKTAMVDPVVLDPAKCFFAFACPCRPIFVCEACREPSANAAILANVPTFNCLACERVCHDLAKGYCKRGGNCNYSHNPDAMKFFKLCFKLRNSKGQQRRLRTQRKDARAQREEQNAAQLGVDCVDTNSLLTDAPLAFDPDIKGMAPHETPVSTIPALSGSFVRRLSLQPSTRDRKRNHASESFTSSSH